MQIRISRSFLFYVHMDWDADETLHSHPQVVSQQPSFTAKQVIVLFRSAGLIVFIALFIVVPKQTPNGVDTLLHSSPNDQFKTRLKKTEKHHWETKLQPSVLLQKSLVS